VGHNDAYNKDNPPEENCSVSLSIGDDRERLDVIMTIARDLLEMNEEEAQRYYDWRTATRLAQFHGRLREVRREGECVFRRSRPPISVEADHSFRSDGDHLFH
jgi:hypothetical protein